MGLKHRDIPLLVVCAVAGKDCGIRIVDLRLLEDLVDCSEFETRAVAAAEKIREIRRRQDQ